MYDNLPKNATSLFTSLVGSRLFGTHTEESDYDYMSVYVSPMQNYTGIIESPDSFVFADKDKGIEHSGLELRKFVKLCTAFNPNVIPTLYSNNTSNYLNLDLIKEREIFNSQHAYHTLLGYARSQRKSVVNGDTGKLGEKRKQLVAQYGYDTKFAMHTIRILYMAIDFFETGKLQVRVPSPLDGYLLEIRNGKHILGRWLELVDTLINTAEVAFKESSLPEKPDTKRINEITMDLISLYAK